MFVSLLWSPARPFPSPSFPSGHPDRGPELAPCRAPRRLRRACKRDRLPGLHTADPSTPLDERYSVVLKEYQPPSEGRPAGLRTLLGPLACTGMKQRVLVASNRGPISYQFATDGSLTGQRGGGGMIAGGMSGLAAVEAQAVVTRCLAP